MAIFVTARPERRSHLQQEGDFSAALRLTQSADSQMFNIGCQEQAAKKEKKTSSFSFKSAQTEACV